MRKLCLWIPDRQTYNFWNSDFLIFPTFKQLLSRILWENFQVSKHILKVLINFYCFTNICDLKFLDNETTALWIFFEIARKSVWLLKLCQMREILKPQFCWYFYNVLLWVILMEMKVSQVGCFQITGLWICYSIFSDISFIVFFTRLLSKSLWRNYPFSVQISKNHFKMQYITENEDV